MPTRWEITKAVRASGLASPARLLMFVLADVAEVGTAEIPEKYTPSVTVLARETGLSKRTVQTHLMALEREGWIGRTRQTPEAMWRGDRVRYRLAIPAPGVVQELHEPGAGDAPGVVQELRRGGAGDAPLKTDLLTNTDQEQNPSSSKKPTKAETHRPDVDKICEHLADRIAANGSKRPPVTAAWRTAARLLLDTDGRTIDQAIAAIDWCQNDDFWRANILSMRKLREKYDQLRLAAQRARARKTTGQREHNGLMLNDTTIADMQRTERLAAIDAQLALEGPPA